MKTFEVVLAVQTAVNKDESFIVHNVEICALPEFVIKWAPTCKTVKHSEVTELQNISNVTATSRRVFCVFPTPISSSLSANMDLNSEISDLPFLCYINTAPVSALQRSWENL